MGFISPMYRVNYFAYNYYFLQIVYNPKCLKYVLDKGCMYTW